MYLELFNLSGEHNSDDESINSHGLAENNRNQVLGFDPGSFDTSADNGGASRVNAQSGANHGQGDREADAQRGPHVGRGLCQKPSDAQSFTTTSQDVVENCQDRKVKFDVSNLKF